MSMTSSTVGERRIAVGGGRNATTAERLPRLLANPHFTATPAQIQIQIAMAGIFCPHPVVRYSPLPSVLLATFLLGATARVASPATPAAPTPADTPATPAAPANPVVAAPEAPTKASQPFENSLGMKFAPVPTTNVLFGVWDVRVQDYAVFASVTGHTTIATKFEQGPTHPAVNVSWDDAQEFCAWLTQRERQAGRLSKNQIYRLPTDAEWSLAVGLAERRDGTPEDKDRQIRNVYPWGTDWPPPKGAGNYDGSLGTDTFLNTSPVGSFAPNKYGLFDMGGNVWQWCDDFLDGRSGPKVVRGASYFNAAADNLFLSRRDSYEAEVHSFLVGFRVVIAGEGGASL